MTKLPKDYCRPSLLRHLAIMLYDLLLLLSILVAASLIATIFNGGNAIEQGNPWFLVYLLTVCWLFYGWFWTHGGQTLGMRSWKVYLIATDNCVISWQHAWLRLALAVVFYLPAGLGIWWQYLSKDRIGWVDLYSATRLHYAKK